MKKALLILLSLLTSLIIMVSCDNSVDYPFDDDVPAVETPEMVPLTFEFIKDGKIIITNKPDNMKFTRNSGAKQDVPVDGIINAEGGDRIKLFATRTSAEGENYLNIKCTSTDICYVYGNVMSLIKEEGFADKKDVFSYAFKELFKGNEKINLHDSKKLVLPATTLADYCYEEMFSGCTSLKSAPALPAQSLTKECYAYMFNDCSSLTSAPELPAMTLATSCYKKMFGKCTSLTTAPKLPASTLANSCYQGMFAECTSLTTAPELLATTLVTDCYKEMFNLCSSLNYIKCLATNPDSGNTTKWVEGVATDGFFYRADNIEWGRGSNGVPTSWLYNDDPILIPLTLEFLEDGELTISNPPAGNMWYSKDGGQTREVLNGTITISVKSGEKISLFANRTSTEFDGIRLRSDQKFYAYGNVMSLNKADGFEKETSLFEYDFFQLFMDDHHLTNHPTIDLVLPATKLAHHCYRNMFLRCSDLIKAPVLPATRVEYHCYAGMFFECTSLTTAPVLPATDFSGYTYFCYEAMFSNCTSLTVPPELPATDISQGCYASMFKGCTNLQTAPNLPATVLKDQCYYFMFNNCTSLTYAPVLPATTLKYECYRSMFEGCTSIQSAPELPATELAKGCYIEMFRGCTNLTTAPLLPATTLAESCYNGMFKGCTKLTTAPSLPAMTLAKSCYRIMFFDCTNLNSITCLATDISADDCTQDWVSGVSSSGTFTKASTMTDWTTSISGIPSGWTVVDYPTP